MSGSTSPLELLAPALGERPVLRLADLQALLDKSDAQLWGMDNSAIFTNITDYESTGERVMECGPAGGDLQEIERLIPFIEQSAVNWGCTIMQVNAGRRGWERVLAKYGYELDHVVLRKVLK